MKKELDKIVDYPDPDSMDMERDVRQSMESEKTASGMTGYKWNIKNGEDELDAYEMGRTGPIGAYGYQHSVAGSPYVHGKHHHQHHGEFV